MKIQYIREFIILAENLNYSLAANRLFISQSALSRHMSILEETVGGQLLVRTTHYVKLTPLGKELLPKWRNLIQEYEYILHFSQSFQGNLSGTLSLGLLYYSMASIYGSFLSGFRKKYPNIRIEIKGYQPHEMYTDLTSGRIDIGEMIHANYPGSENIRFHKLGKTKSIVIMSQDHPLANQSSIDLKDLLNDTLIELEDDYCSAICTRTALAHCGIQFSKVQYAQQLEMVPAVIQECGGIHITGESCKRQNSPGMRYIPLSNPETYLDNCLMYRMDNGNPLIAVFLHEIDQYFLSSKQSQKR